MRGAEIRCANSLAGRRSQLCESSPAGTFVDGDRGPEVGAKLKLSTNVRLDPSTWICLRFPPTNFPGSRSSPELNI